MLNSQQLKILMTDFAETKGDQELIEVIGEWLHEKMGGKWTLADTHERNYLRFSGKMSAVKSIDRRLIQMRKDTPMNDREASILNTIRLIMMDYLAEVQA